MTALGMIAAPLASPAGDYALAAGQSDTLSGPETYGTMTIGGDLTVTGGKKITVDEINIAGGSVTVTGTGTTLGDGGENAAHATTISVTNGANGAYGMLNVHGTGVAADDGLGAAALYIRKEGEDFASDGGYFDFMSISNGTANIYKAYNYSSATGRITVAGTSAIYRRTPRYNYGIFRSGAYQIRLVDDATTLTFNFTAQGGRLNTDGVSVEVCGAGTARLVGSYESTTYAAVVNKGAVFNHAGPLVFVRADNNRNCYFTLADSGVIGPNVTALMQMSGSSSYDTRIAIDSDAAITLCGDVQITGTRAYLTGGRLKVDATDAARSFKCHIKSGDPLVVEKTGANEMVVSSTTNIPNLVVSEGAVRFATNDCVVGSLTAAAETTLVADGCDVTLPPGGEYVGVSFLTENGGRFVKADAARTVIYDLVSITGALHVADGELAFSKYGFSQKWWRWTFKEVYNGPKAYIAGRFFLFGTNGDRVCDFNNTTATASSNDDASGMSAGSVRFKYNAATNITVSSSAKSYQTVAYLRHCFRSATYTSNGNNFPYLSSPIVDPSNSESWISVDARLKDGASRLTGYNMAISLPNRYATAWTVEASYDGKTWETIETRSNVTHAYPGKAYYYYDGYYPSAGTKPSELFHFTGYRNGGLETVDPLSVQVDDGATLDLLAFDDGQTIDLAAGGGTLKGGRIVPGGTLVLNGVAETGANIASALPLAFEGALDAQNFRSWKVVIDGRASGRHPVYANGWISVRHPGCMVVLR